jgi:hypothetical protein
MSANKKRTSDGAAAPALKRRKASAISMTSAPASAHPLRQTSFPPDDAGTPFGARSPSVDVDAMSLVSGSQVSAAAPLKKKRGRKSKAEKAREQTPSVVGGRALTAVSGASDGAGRGSKTVVGGAGGGDEGEGEDEGPTEVAATADVRTKEQKEEEHRMRGMLISALSEDQFYRFENWRAANLSKASVRRVRKLSPSCLLVLRSPADRYLARQRNHISVGRRKRRNRNACGSKGLHRRHHRERATGAGRVDREDGREADRPPDSAGHNQGVSQCRWRRY